MNLRLQAVYILFDVLIQKKSLSDAFETHLKEGGEQGFIKEISFGVLRFYSKLSFIALRLLNKKMKEKDQDIFILILLGLYQLLEMRVPPYAAVKETVEVISLLKKPWAKNLVNAVLRNFLRQKNEIMEAIAQDEVAFYSHPKWMLSFFKNDWPCAWKQIVEVNNVKAPLTLRINLKKISREDYLEKVLKINLNASLHPWMDSAVIVHDAVEATQLPGFFEGEVSIQDASAQLAAPLLELKPHQRVLDACAAPGGKTTHLLEVEQNLDVTAIDKDKNRLKRVRENLDRLKMNAKIQCVNAVDTKKWWDGNPFDRILLDAPCTASGVIRRHPDIKWLRQEKDVEKTAQLQTSLLESLWPLLKPAGILLYCTCSVFKKENEETIKKFITSRSDCEEIKIKEKWGIDLQVGKQILPSFENDGFYFSKLIKRNV